MNNEEWRDIPGLKGYQASSLGRIRKLHMVKQNTTRRGYKRVSTNGRRVYSHRLVAAAFIGPCPNGFEVNHKDGDSSNNAPDNLEYVTRAENMKHAQQVLKRWENAKGTPRKLTEEAVNEIRQLYASGGITYEKLAAQFDISIAMVGFVVRGELWSHL